MTHNRLGAGSSPDANTKLKLLPFNPYHLLSTLSKVIAFCAGFSPKDAFRAFLTFNSPKT